MLIVRSITPIVWNGECLGSMNAFARGRTDGRTRLRGAQPFPHFVYSATYSDAYISFDRHGSRDRIKKWMLLCSFHWQIANIENCRYSASKSKVQYIGSEITNGKKKIYIYMCVCVCVLWVGKLIIRVGEKFRACYGAMPRKFAHRTDRNYLSPIAIVASPCSFNSEEFIVRR